MKTDATMDPHDQQKQRLAQSEIWPESDEHGLLRSPPGLYLEPPLHDPALDDLMVTVGALGLRFDARTDTAVPS